MGIWRDDDLVRASPKIGIPDKIQGWWGRSTHLRYNVRMKTITMMAVLAAVFALRAEWERVEGAFLAPFRENQGNHAEKEW